MSDFSKDEMRQWVRDWMDAITAIQEEDTLKRMAQAPPPLSRVDAYFSPPAWWERLARSIYTMHTVNLLVAALLALILWRVW